MNEVEILFQNKVIQRGGVTLLAKPDALQFVEACAKRRIRILGIDGFLLHDDKIQPSMENSIDFSLKSFDGDPFQSARDLLNRSTDDMYFEVVCE